MRTFKSEHTTNASRTAVWEVWREVANWQQWDTELESAQLESAFAQGGRGTLTPKNAPKSPFTITELTEGVSFTYSVPMPLARLEVAHYFRPAAQTIFVHEVTFNGVLGGVFGRLLGTRYATALPEVLNRIAALAEKRSV